MGVPTRRFPTRSSRTAREDQTKNRQNRDDHLGTFSRRRLKFFFFHGQNIKANEFRIESELDEGVVGVGFDGEAVG
jgi:hypothetical protein